MCDPTTPHAHCPPLARRGFLRLAALGGSAALLGPASALAGGRAKALMLSCMDYRLVDDLVTLMQGMGLHDNYDHVVLAGASLGVVSDKFEAWHETFWQHLAVARQLHHIEEVIVIDHRDCGAYRLALGEAALATPEQETEMHTLALREFALRVAARHPELRVSGYLMALDGTVEEIAVMAA